MDKFFNIDDNPDMGLNNKICEKKDYYCKTHRVYLSKEDVEMKSCLKKQSFDMLGVKTCSWLIKIEKAG